MTIVACDVDASTASSLVLAPLRSDLIAFICLSSSQHGKHRELNMSAVQIRCMPALSADQVMRVLIAWSSVSAAADAVLLQLQKWSLLRWRSNGFS